ncbi:ankyrin repeat-containing domain protein [Glomus cerebriforme]|uniref:Ankyrin repeat-containing domain protein n=1 Tax=Glomus cerebriforme TaxID=658196 RepID=A0A397SHB6_9GLOM|nr:ankyrin repeat-containing domain protein [Glomus cerebriforme]
MASKDPTITKYLSSFRTNDINGIQKSLIDESTYRQLFARQPEDVDPSQLLLLHQPYLNLINVYENKDIWKIKNRFFNNESGEDDGMYVMPLPKDKRLNQDDPAICLGGNETFQKNWNLFTESSLSGLDWSNVFAAGGAVLSCLLPIPKEYDVGPRKIREWYHNIAYKSSDIDLFIYGLNDEAAKQKMEEIYETVCNAVPWEVACFRSNHCVTILSQYPYRHIQIVLRLYKSPSEILTGFDVDCCCVGFDGKNVWALPRAHQAIIKQCNMIDLTRRSPSYEMRLAKYTERGFEIKVPLLERSRIDPTIYEKSFEKLNGLARLLVLERLNTPDNRFEYVEKKRERNCRPKHPKSGIYASRKWARAKNMKGSKFENSDYETVILPYGLKYDAKRIMRMIYKKDMTLNSSWIQKQNQRVLHRHPCFFSTDIKRIFGDCCGYCPVPKTPEEVATQIEEDKIFVRGKMEFMKDDPGRQTVGSFHPLTDDDWTTQAYITNVREDLCCACARGAVDIVESILKQNSVSTDDENSQIKKVDIEARDYLGRTPLQLAVLGGHTEIVNMLLKHDARIIARMSDGKTVVHLASQYGFLDILELLLQKSDENKKKAQEKEHAKSHLEANNQMKTPKQENQKTNKDDDLIDSFEIIEIDQTSSKDQEQDLGLEEEEEQDDIIDLNVGSWDHSLAPLDYAILFGQVEILKRLIKAGANVRRPIKLQIQKNNHYYYRAIKEDKVYFPLLLCLLTQNQQSGLEMATILLENGATPSQLDYNYNSILHLAVRTGKTQFVKLFFDVDPKSSQIINSLNSSFESPLYLAVANNHLEITELLIKHGARATITLDDIQEYETRKKIPEYNRSSGRGNNVGQPISRALQNDLYRALIKAGADVNSMYRDHYQNHFYSYHQNSFETIRDHVANSIKTNESDIKKYEEELACLNGKKKLKTSNEEQIIKIIQYLNTLLEEEKKRVEKGSYREYALNYYTAEKFYDILQRKKPELFSPRNVYPLYGTHYYEDVNKLKEKYTKLLESEIKKLNYNKECLEYLIGHGAKTFKEVNLENNLEIPKKLMKEYQEQLNAIKILLEEQAEMLAAEEKERYLKEETLLQHAVNKQQEHIDKIYNEYHKSLQLESPNIVESKQDSTFELSSEILSRNTLSSSGPFIKINFEESVQFNYLDNLGKVVPPELVPEYVKLFHAVYVNDIRVVEKMAQYLVLAVQDEFGMTPFMWTCLRGHNELAVKILDIVTRQYVPKEADGDENMNTVNNYDLETGSDDYGYNEPSQTTSMDVPEEDDNKSKFLNVKPISNYSVYNFLIYKKSFITTEVVPEEFLRKHTLIQSYFLNGFEVAVLRNDLETAKKILDFVEDNNSFEYPEKKSGGLVTNLIRGQGHFMKNRSPTRSPMIDSIYFGYVDMIDLLIEYAAGGNNFSVFDINEPEEENFVPNYYTGLVDYPKEKFWKPYHNQMSHLFPVEPSYLFYAAYYGNITSIRYFFSDRPIKALNKFAQKYINKNSEDLRITILSTIEDVQKVGRKLFTYELFKNQTPFHWAVQENKHDVIKELARLYKEEESKEQADDDQLTLEEILDMRADITKVTALLLAAQLGYDECIKALLEVGADPGITDHNGWSLAHYAANKNYGETIRLLHELLQPETYQRMLEQRSKFFNHTPISISILSSNIKLTEYLLQGVTPTNLFTYDFENNRYLHLSLKEGLWYISKKLIELDSTISNEDKSLYHENSFGQTPTDIAIQMFLNRLVSVAVFEPPPSQLPPELDFNNKQVEEKDKMDEEAVEKCAIKAFNLMVPFYLPRNKGNPLSKRILVEFNAVNDMVHKLAEKISNGRTEFKEDNGVNLGVQLFKF